MDLNREAVVIVGRRQFRIRHGHVGIEDDRRTARRIEDNRVIDADQRRRIVHAGGVDIHRSQGRRHRAVAGGDRDRRHRVAIGIRHRRVTDIGDSIEIGADIGRAADQRDRPRVHQRFGNPGPDRGPVARRGEGSGRCRQGHRQRIAIDLREGNGRQVDIAERVFGDRHGSGNARRRRRVVNRRRVDLNRTQRRIDCAVIRGNRDRSNAVPRRVGRGGVANIRRGVQIGGDVRRAADQRDRRRVDQGFGDPGPDRSPVARRGKGSGRRGQRDGQIVAVQIRETDRGQVDIAQHVFRDRHRGRNAGRRRRIVHRRDRHCDGIIAVRPGPAGPLRTRIAVVEDIVDLNVGRGHVAGIRIGDLLDRAVDQGGGRVRIEGQDQRTGRIRCHRPDRRRPDRQVAALGQRSQRASIGKTVLCIGTAIARQGQGRPVIVAGAAVQGVQFRIRYRGVGIQDRRRLFIDRRRRIHTREDRRVVHRRDRNGHGAGRAGQGIIVGQRDGYGAGRSRRRLAGIIVGDGLDQRLHPGQRRIGIEVDDKVVPGRDIIRQRTDHRTADGDVRPRRRSGQCDGSRCAEGQNIFRRHGVGRDRDGQIAAPIICRIVRIGDRRVAAAVEHDGAAVLGKGHTIATEIADHRQVANGHGEVCGRRLRAAIRGAVGIVQCRGEGLCPGAGGRAPADILQQSLHPRVGGIGVETDFQRPPGLTVICRVYRADIDAANRNRLTRRNRAIAAGRHIGPVDREIAIGGIVAAIVGNNQRPAVVVGGIRVGDSDIAAIVDIGGIAHLQTGTVAVQIADHRRVVHRGQGHGTCQVRRRRVTAAIGRAAIIRNPGDGDHPVPRHRRIVRRVAVGHAVDQGLELRGGQGRAGKTDGRGAAGDGNRNAETIGRRRDVCPVGQGDIRSVEAENFARPVGDIGDGQSHRRYAIG